MPAKITYYCITVNAPEGDDMVGWFRGVQQQCDVKPYMSIDRPNFTSAGFLLTEIL
ncbi:MAG: hypothetical protein LBE04_06705 [Prevotellaceae bacterium]|nr:hypothetical protein [Prevotellaceae bacterium]